MRRNALGCATKKKSLAGSEAQCYPKRLYLSGNAFVKLKMWNCPSLARGRCARMGHPKALKRDLPANRGVVIS
jgi:hypothetical protein